MSSPNMRVRPEAFARVYTHLSLLVVVLGQESTVLIKRGGQFAGHPESTVGLDPDSYISVLQSRGRAGDSALWAFYHGSLC